jgi:hypothetical protein
MYSCLLVTKKEREKGLLLSTALPMKHLYLSVERDGAAADDGKQLAG